MEPIGNTLDVLLFDDGVDRHMPVRNLPTHLQVPGTNLQWATDYESTADAVPADDSDSKDLQMRAGHLEAEEATIAANRQLNDIIEFLPDATLVIDKEGKVIAWNHAMEVMTGIAAGDMLGKGNHEYTYPFYGKRRPMLIDLVLRPEAEIEAEYARTERKGPALIGEIHIASLKGREAYLFGAASALMDSMGNVTGAIESIRDITDRKAMETRLIQARKMEAIGTLAGGIAHDFNNILAAIMGYAELAQQDASAAKTPHYVQQILKSCNRARDLISQILTFSRSAELEPVPVDMAHLAKESLGLLHTTLPSTVQIHTRIDPGACIVLGDSAQMQQIVLNLCTNAAHAMRERGGILEVAIENVVLTTQTLSVGRDLPPGPYVRLTVSDTGTGIPLSIMDRIFDPFFTTRERGAGTGLGLSIVYAVVKERGGAVTVESEEGKGASFIVHLPAAAAQEQPEPATIDSSTGHSERILFVDDEEVLVEMAREMLQELGYRVVAVKSSTLALDLFLANPDTFDLVVTDMTMPGMTGMDIATQMLAVRPDIPVILCTGFSELITEERAKQLGIREFLTKPYSLADLSRALGRVQRNAGMA